VATGARGSEEAEEGSNKPNLKTERKNKMKKLMIAAALAASTAAFGACTDPTVTPTTTVLGNAVYTWQFKGKTGTAVVVKGTGDTQEGGGYCADPTTVPGTADEVIRVPGSLALIGYTYICDLECVNFAQQLLNPTKAQYYATAPWKSTIIPYRGRNFVTGIDVSHVIGKSKTQYELAGTATFTFDNSADLAETFVLTFAGFGSFDKKNHRVTSVSGNFAGTQTPPRYGKKLNNVACPPADYWTCDTLAYAGAPMDPSVAYGTWSIKYNASATKKFESNQTAYWVK